MQKEHKDFTLQGFEKTLHPNTIKYLTSKTKSSENMDLRQISDDVNFGWTGRWPNLTDRSSTSLETCRMKQPLTT